MKKLGKRELSIISYLRQDARMKLTDLSRKTQTAVSTVFERIKRFRESGLIRLTALLDFADLGFFSRIMVAVKVDREIREEIEDYLAGHPNINTVLHVNNGFSLVFEALFRDMFFIITRTTAAPSPSSPPLSTVSQLGS